MARQKKELDRFEKNPKRNVQILTKLLGIIIGSVILGVIGVGIFELELFDKGIRQSTDRDLGNFAHGLKMTLKDWRDTLEADVMLVATRVDFIEAVEEQNTQYLRSGVSSTNSNLNVEVLAIVDNSGKVLAGEGVGLNSNLSSINSVQSAIRGTAAYSYEEIGDAGYSIIATCPLQSSGSTIGAVVAAYSLVNGDIVNQVRDSYNADCTIFKEATRISTTLGENFIGTTLDNKTIVNEVLNQGNEYHGNNVISGQKYLSVYFPLEGSDGKITGMAFIAKSMAVVDSIRNDTFKIVAPIALVLIVLLAFFSFRFVHWLMWRIYNVTNFLKELETGDADLTKRCKLFIRDEIGDLIIHFDLFLDKLQEIMGEVKGTNKELGESGSSLSSGTEDTASAITQIIANIRGVHGQITSQTNSVNQTADVVHEISKSITTLNDMVENQSHGVSQASSAMEEIIGNIASVTTSVDKMAESFNILNNNIQVGISKQQSVNERIKQIENQSQMLGEANTAISNIASQTNLLAMNAAIEAAHAGEAGKGFSVVADEIRKLSETSSAQSRSIGDQLTNIRDSIGDVVSSSNEATDAFNAVASYIKQTDELVIQIKAAMEEQNAGSQQIGDALRNMNESTMEVQRSSKNMAERNEQIMGEMQNLQSSTTSMQSSMEEMSAGAKKINETGSALAEISKIVQSAINKIGNQIDRFKTE